MDENITLQSFIHVLLLKQVLAHLVFPYIWNFTFLFDYYMLQDLEAVKIKLQSEQYFKVIHQEP